LSKGSKEQEALVQKVGLLGIMGARAGNKDRLMSIMLQHCAPILVCDPTLQGLLIFVERMETSPAACLIKAHPKEHFVSGALTQAC